MVQGLIDITNAQQKALLNHKEIIDSHTELIMGLIESLKDIVKEIIDLEDEISKLKEMKQGELNKNE